MADIDKFEVYEKEGRFYDLDFYDQAGTKITLANMATLKLSLFLKDAATLTTINGRAQQNVLNTNNVTVQTAGDIQWAIQPADTTMQDAGCESEIHIAVFELTTTSTPALVRRKEVYLIIDNVEAVS